MTESTLALASRSLLKQYAAYKSTNVLVYTKLLPKYPHRRILTTMQFVMDVMDPNGFNSEGYAIRSIQKLRLVHAMIRERIGQASDYGKKKDVWDMDWGEPINQQDMLFAIHTFSVEVLRGLIASGEYVSQEERDNYYLAWHIIGRSLGVNPKINPTNYDIGVQTQQRIYDKEFIVNDNAPILAEPLMEFLDETLPLANRFGIIGLVKLFNDPQDYDPVFKKILKIDMDSGSDYYVKLYKIADKSIHWFLRIKYFFLPSTQKKDFEREVAERQHKLFERIVGLSSTWAGEHFRISDGFGEWAAKMDAEKMAKEPPMWKRILKDLFGRIFPSLFEPKNKS